MMYLVFESNFIALVEYLGIVKELSKTGYKIPVGAFYTDDTKLYKISEIWHLSLDRAPIFYREYEVGYITHFDDKNRINLSKMKTDKKKGIISQLFAWSHYNWI